MPIWIIYGLVLIFFLAFPLLVLSFVRKPEASTQALPSSTTSSHIDKVSYGILATLFAVFFILTFSMHRNKS